MAKYKVITGTKRVIWSGDDFEEAVYQCQEYNCEYPEIGARIVGDDKTSDGRFVRTYETEYLQAMSQTAMRQIIETVGDNVVASWGIRGWGCGEVENDDGYVLPCLIIDVTGLIHTGRVIVAYNEGEDTYEVALFDVNGAKVSKWHSDVYFDELGSLIDSLVERPAGMSDEDYKELSELDSFVKMLSDAMKI